MLGTSSMWLTWCLISACPLNLLWGHLLSLPVHVAYVDLVHWYTQNKNKHTMGFLLVFPSPDPLPENSPKSGPSYLQDRMSQNSKFLASVARPSLHCTAMDPVKNWRRTIGVIRVYITQLWRGPELRNWPKWPGFLTTGLHVRKEEAFKHFHQINHPRGVENGDAKKNGIHLITWNFIHVPYQSCDL